MSLTDITRRLSLRWQIVLLTAAATALAVALLTVVLQLLLIHLANNDVDRVVRDRATSVITSIDVKDGVITVPKAQLSAGVAVYGPGGTLAAGDAPENVEHDYARLRLSTKVTTVSHGDSSRIEARPFRRSGVSGVVIVSEPFEPYHEAERLALLVSVVAGLVTVGAVAGVAAWATTRALRPVDQMARTAADWSEHDLARRFALGETTTELGELAATLDGLLDRVSATIRSEQRLTAELAHELRTPLTTIRGEAELMLMRDALPPRARAAAEEVVAASQRMTATISTLLDLARSEATVVAASQSSLADVLADVRRDVDTGAVTLSTPADDVRLAVPHALAVRAFAPVVENAVRFARARVAVTVAGAGHGHVDVRVEDDGPGLVGADTEEIFEPGATTGQSAGLGLAISRRVARTSGGDVTLAPDSRPGANAFVVRLPVV